VIDVCYRGEGKVNGYDDEEIVFSDLRSPKTDEADI
jgi:hypothetical protein